MLLTTVWL